MARKPTAVSKKAAPEQVERVSHAFYIIRQFAIYAAAKLGMRTEDIAKKLDVNRSFVIRQTEIALKPRNGAERRVLKLANEVVPQVAFARTMVGKLLGAEDVSTTLAGGERPKLGPLADRRAAAKKAKAAPKAKAPAKKPAKAAAPKKPSTPAAKPSPAKQATAAPAKPKKLPPQPKPKTPVEAPAPEPAKTVGKPKAAKPQAKPKEAPAQASLPVPEPAAATPATPAPDQPLRRPAAKPQPAPEAQVDDPLNGLFGDGT